MDRNAGYVFRLEEGWWDYEDTFSSWVQVKFYWAETYNAGYDSRWIGRGAFLGEFNATDNGYTKGSATEGPVIETILGDVETIGFDLDDGSPDTYGEDKRQCLGFTVAWDRTPNFALHNKILHAYPCGERGAMAKWRLQGILKRLSIEGEFDSLIDG